MGCSINPLSWGDCAGDLLGKAAGGLASAGFDAVVGEFAKGVGNIVKTLATFWTNVPTEKLSTAQGTPVGMLTAMLDWVMLAVGLLSILLVAAHMALTHRGDALADAGTGIVRFILVTSCQVPAIALLAGAGDEFSKWIINTAADGNFDKRVGQVFGTALASGPLGTAVVFIGCLLAIAASIAQVIAMVARNGVLIITAAASPIAAAAAIYKGNEEMWRKLWMWQLAFVLYKPVAATVYAAAFVTVGDGKSATDQLSGLALMIMSVLALPALLRLMMPISSKMSAGGGGGALAGAAVAASGVGSVIASRGGGGGGGTGGGSSAPQGPSGASGVSTSAPAAAGASGASGAGAASGGATAAGAAGGPPGMAIGAAVQAAGAVKGMAESAAASGTQEK
jgi:type IV secretion system protein TrbL